MLWDTLWGIHGCLSPLQSMEKSIFFEWKFFFKKKRCKPARSWDSFWCKEVLLPWQFPCRAKECISKQCSDIWVAVSSAPPAGVWKYCWKMQTWTNEMPSLAGVGRSACFRLCWTLLIQWWVVTCWFWQTGYYHGRFYTHTNGLHFIIEDYFLLVWNYLTDLSYFKLILWKNKGESVLCMEQ